MKFPLGARGERPVFFAAQCTYDQSRYFTSIPGVVRVPGGFQCTWDAAPFLAAELGQPSPTPPLEANVDLEAEIKALPGLQRYYDLGFDKKLRDYQKEAALYLSRRSFGMNCDPPRAGKSFTALAGTVLVDAKKTLIVTVSLGKYVWAEQIAKWLKSEAVILEGRGGDVVRTYCVPCDSRGRITVDGKSEPCQYCRLTNGQSRGFRLNEVKESKDGLLVCRKHKVRESVQKFTRCLDCQLDLHNAIDRAEFIITNPELLCAQKSTDAAGREFFRDDLEGWGPTLAKYKFDLCIYDESHNYLRGFTTDQRKRGTSKREKVGQVTENIDRVWALTGTPVFGYTRDLWGQLDAISKGAVSGPDNRLPFSFHSYFCGGHKGNYGWVADGRSEKAETELPQRLDYFKIQRPRSLILASLPPKQRQTIRIDNDKTRALRFARNDDERGKIAKLLKQTLDTKLETVVDNVIAELTTGAKCIVFCQLKESARKVAKSIENASRNRENVTRMRQVDVKIWHADGDVPNQGRFEMARSFRDHEGAGVFVATIDAVQVAVSLKGATSVHFAELHHSPSALLQAEDRPFELGTTGLSILYYVVRDSIDEHMHDLILPKLETLTKLVNEKGAEDMRAAFDEPETRTLSQLLESLTAHILSDDDIPEY